MEDATIMSHLHILENLASTLEMEEVFKRIVEAAVYFAKADEGSLLLLDEKTGELYMRAAKGFGEEYAKSFRQQVNDDSIAGQVMITGRPVLIGPESGLGEQIKVKTGYLAQSILNLPIKRGNITHGVLGVYNSGSKRVFSHRHLILLSPLAKYAAIAIENAHRFQEAYELLSEAYRLSELLELSYETLELDKLLDIIAANALGRLMLADRVVIHLLDPVTGRLERKVRVPHKEEQKIPHGFEVGEGVAGRVLKENHLINVPDVDSEKSFEKRGLLSGSLIVAPITRRSLSIGTISVASLQKSVFKPHDERFLTILANLAGVAIENARLITRQEQLYKESQERLKAVEHRNRELKSLRDILGALQSTLSLPEVLARIAEGVVKGLNYKAVMLSTVDEDKQLLVVQEFALESNSIAAGLLEQGERLVGQRLVGNNASLQLHKENIGIQVCLDGQTRVTHTLFDIFRPVVNQGI